MDSKSLVLSESIIFRANIFNYDNKFFEIFTDKSKKVGVDFNIFLTGI